jgi:Xyloglucan fucosyltransferase.
MPSIPLSVGMQNLSSLDVMQNLSSLDVIERPLSEDEDIYIISSNVLSNKHTNWLKESELLKKVLKPVPIIETEIKKYGSMRNHVGIHIRMGQQNSLHDSTEGWVEPCKKSWKKWRENSHVSIFIRKVEEILHKTPNQKFFLAADTKHSYDMFLNRFENIRYVPRKLFDRSAEQVKYALIDIFLLSQTDYLLGSNWSTFTEIAQKLGGKKCFFAGIDFL